MIDISTDYFQMQGLYKFLVGYCINLSIIHSRTSYKFFLLSYQMYNVCIEDAPYKYTFNLYCEILISYLYGDLSVTLK